MKALITGGAGFIGSHLAELLVESGAEVRVLDDLSSGNIDNLSHISEHIDFIQGSITDLAMVQKAAEGIELIFHHAALVSVPASIEQPIDNHERNLTGLLNVLLASRDANARRLVFASSAAIYGNNPENPKREDMLPDPVSPYAAAKLSGEHYCRVFSQVYGLETVVLRYFNIFGPRQSPNSPYAAAIPKFAESALKGHPITVFGDGEQTRYFCYAENVAAANLKAAQTSGISGKVFNIASGVTYSVNQALNVTAGIIRKELEVHYEAERAGDVKHSSADISAARELLGYQPAVDFTEGLRRTIEWLKSKQGELA
jgi:nucleoside-diphosphate-sugar epimerase